MKAVIVDLDRTLLHTDKTLSGYTLDIMRKCHEKGLAVMAATARPQRSVLEYDRLIRFDAVIAMNGAKIILPGLVLENGISHLSGTHILSRLVSIPDALISVEMTEGIFSSAAIPEWNSRRYRGFPALPTQGTLYKILVSRGSNGLRNQIESALTEEVYYTVAGGDLIQIMSKNATKWNGIKTALKVLNIPQEETVYFGDDHDDIEPIRMCGVGVAVSNAIEAAIQAADHTAGSNDEDGVAHYIEANLL